jgi:hypothetical protein
MTFDDAWPGRRCVWRHTPRGGYGFTLRIPVTVLSRGGTSALVRVEATGDKRTVTLTRLVDADMRTEDGRRAEPPAPR